MISWLIMLLSPYKPILLIYTGIIGAIEGYQALHTAQNQLYIRGAQHPRGRGKASRGKTWGHGVQS